MKNRIKLAVLIAMVFTLIFSNAAIANTENDAVIAETLEQIENPNPQAIESLSLIHI